MIGLSGRFSWIQKDGLFGRKRVRRQGYQRWLLLPGQIVADRIEAPEVPD